MTFFPVTHIVKLTLNYLHVRSPPSPAPRARCRSPGAGPGFVLLMREKKQNKIPLPGVHTQLLEERTPSPGLWKLAGGVLFPR